MSAAEHVANTSAHSSYPDMKNRRRVHHIRIRRRVGAFTYPEGKVPAAPGNFANKSLSPQGGSPRGEPSKLTHSLTLPPTRGGGISWQIIAICIDSEAHRCVLQRFGVKLLRSAWILVHIVTFCIGLEDCTLLRSALIWRQTAAPCIDLEANCCVPH